MSKSKEDQEKKELVEFFSELDKDTLKMTFEALSMMVRAFEGQPVEPEDVITRLTNVKNILERSRFPTYPILQKNVYLRLVAKYYEDAKACEDWADLEAEALIEYKGEGRKEYVEQTKGLSSPEQMFILGGRLPETQQPKKSRFSRFRRQPQEETEFTSQ